MFSLRIEIRIATFFSLFRHRLMEKIIIRLIYIKISYYQLKD